MTPRVIAIDGPAASGKSSTAALVARRLGWAHLDSGALYRALTLAALDNLKEQGVGRGASWSGQKIVALAEDLPVRLVLVEDDFKPEVAGVDVEEEIRSERVTRHVSAVAAIPEVRTWVNARQREAAASHPSGVVVDGRDIGTVVFPEAPVKLFLWADPTARGARRAGERAAPDHEVATALHARDASDERVHPHVPAEDAVTLDTTDATRGRTLDLALKIVRERLP